MKKIILSLTFYLLLAITTIYAQKNLSLLGSLNFPGQSLSGVWHYNDTTGKEYALIGAFNGIAIVDITNPTNPQQIIQLPGVGSTWHEVKVIGDYAYAVSEGFDPGNILNGIQIIDLRYLPDSVPYKFYTGSGGILGQLNTAHSITAAGHNLYINGHNISGLGRGVLILDITNPWFPEYVGAVTNRYCHDSYVRGDTIYTSDIGDGLFSIYDITDRTNPVLLATQGTPGQFNHNTWLSDNGQFIYTTDEKMNQPLASYDISDFNNITLLDTFYNGNFKDREVHNVRVFNDYLITPSYGSQLTLVDAARPANLIEVGNYTTGNSLCWDADPYLNSGNIIATDMNDTFYVFGPTYIRACYVEGIVTDSVTDLPIFNATIEIQVAEVTEFSDAAGIYRTGYADTGMYLVKYSKTGYFDRYENVNLQNGVLDSLNIKLVPINANVVNAGLEKVEIYPNPVSENIFIEPANNIISRWEIKDECGRIIQQERTVNQSLQKFSVNTGNLPKGFYTFELFSGDKKIVRKIVKLN
jgi:choice-of-anchor B domain-containing protein